MDARGDGMIMRRRPVARIAMSIYEQVLTFIHRPEPESFDRLALEVFRHQFEAVGAYRRYCEERGVDPGAVRMRGRCAGGQQCRIQVRRACDRRSRAIRGSSDFSHQRDHAGAGTPRTPYRCAARDLSRVGDRSSAHDAVPRRSANGDSRDASDRGRDAGVVAGGDDQLVHRRIRDAHASGGRIARPNRCRGSDRVSCRRRGAARTGLHPGHHGGIRGAVFRASQRRRETSARSGFANDGHRRSERAGRSRCKPRR